MKELKMTEQQWIAKFKKKGFELYKTKELLLRLNAFYKIENIIAKVKNK